MPTARDAADGARGRRQADKRDVASGAGHPDRAEESSKGNVFGRFLDKLEGRGFAFPDRP